MEPAWIALIATIFGGVGLKVVEHWLSRSNRQLAVRQEFRAEIVEMRERLDKVEAELDEWRGKYYAAQEEILVLKAMMIGAGIDPTKPK